MANRPGSQKRRATLYRRRAFYEQDARCFWCDGDLYWAHSRMARIVPNQRVSAEHLIPHSKGGRTERKNIVAACYGCNQERGNTDVSEWLAVIRPRVPGRHFGVILQRLAKLGISTVIGHPAPAAPTVELQPIVRAPEITEPAPS